MGDPSEPEVLPTEDRWRAASAGRSVYIGTPCKTCHNQQRYTGNGACRTCTIKKAQEYQEEVRRLLREKKG